MIELVVLDENFNVLGIIDGFQTLMWKRKYYETGAYELHCSDEYFALLKAGKYLYRKDRDELGILRGPAYNRDNTGQKKAVASGKFAESLLSDRIFAAIYDYSGTAEAVPRAMVTDLAISPADTDRVIPHLALGDAAGLGTAVEGQVFGENLHDKVREVCKAQELSIKIRLDYLTNALLFTVWQGLDRTQNQTANAWATFSDDFENVISTEIKTDKTDLRNVAYVAGEGEGEDRIVEEVDLSDGGERRELWLEASDVTRTQDGVTLPELEYRALLHQRGVEKLAEYNGVESVNCEIDANSNLVYRTDFDLGDLCTYVDNDHGVLSEARITEIDETYENGVTTIAAVIGEGKMTIKKYIDRGLKNA